MPRNKKSSPDDSLSMTWDPDKGPSDDQLDAARRILKADYYTSIRAMGREIAERVRAGDGDVWDIIHETADGSYWVIYTHANYQAMLASDHAPFEDVADNGGEVTSAVLAYYCVRHDLEEQVNAELGDAAP